MHRPVRALVASIGILGAVGLVGVHAAGAASPPVALSGKTNVHKKKDLSASTTAKLTLEQDDYYFSPTFIKVQPGEKLTLTIKNEGKVSHTFTSDALNVDKTLAPDKTTKMTITIPASGGTIEFHCSFHQAMGMQGAFYTGTSSGGSAAATPATVSTADTKVGKVLVDSSGRTLYQFDHDSGSTIACTGQCASIWPPVMATGTPTAGSGLDASKLAVVAGPNGNQVTYAGHPLYLYSNDHAAGDVNGQGVAGIWWVLGADGNKITTTPTS